MYDIVIADYENEQKRVMDENIHLRKLLTDVYGLLVSKSKETSYAKNDEANFVNELDVGEGLFQMYLYII